MSRWDREYWYKPEPKKPPPERGIKLGKSGSTWWGRRWVEALERLSSGYSNRLARGRTYARAGRTHDLLVEEGKVTAKVTGSRATPYKVTIAIGKLSAAVWDQAIAAMARQAQFSAELLAGRMPQEIDAAFLGAGGALFPVREADLATSCSCPDWANPCKHIAATHYVLGEALDRDPFLLFELRGRSKAQVLDALRAARAGGGDEPPAPRRRAGRAAYPSAEVPSVSLGEVAAADYDKSRQPLAALHLRFESPPLPGGVLRQLGAPAGWGRDESPVELLGPVIRAAADRARGLAMAEMGSTTDPSSTANGGAPAARPTTRKATTPRAERAKTAKAPAKGTSKAKGPAPKAAPRAAAAKAVTYKTEATAKRRQTKATVASATRARRPRKPGSSP